jgi:hypothetical protein
LFPNYDGNGMWLSMGNIDAAAQIGGMITEDEYMGKVMEGSS